MDLFRDMQSTFGELRRRFIIAVGLVFLVASFGTAGYMLLEGWNLFDSLYMTVITLASVGFKEIHDLSLFGRIFTIILIIGGVGTVPMRWVRGPRSSSKENYRKYMGGEDWKRG